MDLPADVRSHAEDVLGRFCAERRSGKARGLVRLLVKVHDTSVTLLEERPHPRTPLAWTLTEIARFRYAAADGKWTLYFWDRAGQWLKYTPQAPSGDLSRLVQTVRRDRMGLFFWR